MSESSESPPIYLCESFGVTNPAEVPRMQEWLNTQADLGYRLRDRQVFASGGASKRVNLVMELQVPPEPEPGADEGGA